MHPVPTVIIITQAGRLQPMLPRNERVTATHVRAAFHAVHAEDWQAAVACIRDGAAQFRRSVSQCSCNRENCPGWSAPAPAWNQYLIMPAANAHAVAESWRMVEPDWQPMLHCTWRQWMLVHAGMHYARELLKAELIADPVAAAGRRNVLLAGLARLVMAGERKAAA